MLNTFQRLLERSHDEPKQAADFTQKTACELADSLGNQKRWISVCHGRQKSPYLPHTAKGKVRRGKAMRGRIALQSTSCEVSRKAHSAFAAALGVHARPHAACFDANMNKDRSLF